jgi:hypothetical protein
MFRLRKWYLDLVTDDGRAFVGYWAALRWGLVSLSYYGWLYLDARQHLHTVNRFRRTTEPRLTGPTLTWLPPGLHGAWHRSAPPIHERLLDRPDCYVDWHCQLPRADVDVRHESYGVLQGLGYAEYLELTVPPWRLPLRQLHWGRFLSASDSLIWIRWVSATEPRTLVFRNGVRQRDAVVESDVVQCGYDTLRFSEKVSLRAGSLGQTVLSNLGLFKRLIPSRVRSLDEQKWRSRGTFEDRTGWVIHELVTWP